MKRISAQVELTPLEFGDAAIMWRTREGIRTIGVERKTVPDLLQCIKDARFAGHQFPGLKSTYDAVILLVEGEWREEDGTRNLTLKRWEGGKPEWRMPGGRPMTVSATSKWLLTVAIEGGVHLVRTFDLQDSARWLRDIHDWAQEKEHKSLKVIHHKAKPGLSYVEPGEERKFAALLPGIGWERSEAVVRKFGTIRKMVLGEEEDWLSIPGIGKGTWAKVKEVLK